MILRQLFHHESSTFTYIIGSEKSGNAIIIDPVLEMTQVYANYLSQLDLSLSIILETHTHADHITAANALRELTGARSMAGRQSKSDCMSYKFTDGEQITLDEDVKITCLYTPGHTDDSYSFLLESSDESAVFTGDTLLIRSCGRTDFQNGNASELFESITTKLFKLDAQTKLYPGHDYRGFNVSTIGEEIKWNNRLAKKNKDQFIELMSSLDLPSPKLMDIAVPANQACGKTL